MVRLFVKTIIRSISCFHRGGFLVIPHTIEFYQGQSNRLSDRIQFRLESDKSIPLDPTVTHQGINGWVFQRLSP